MASKALCPSLIQLFLPSRAFYHSFFATLVFVFPTPCPPALPRCSAFFLPFWSLYDSLRAAAEKKVAVNCSDKGETEGDTQIKGGLSFIFLITDRPLCSFNWTGWLSVVEGCMSKYYLVFGLLELPKSTTELRKSYTHFLYKTITLTTFRCNVLRQADTVGFLIILNVRSAQQEPPTFSVRINRPTTTWLLTMNVNTEPPVSFVHW